MLSMIRRACGIAALTAVITVVLPAASGAGRTPTPAPDAGPGPAQPAEPGAVPSSKTRPADAVPPAEAPPDTENQKSQPTPEADAAPAPPTPCEEQPAPEGEGEPEDEHEDHGDEEEHDHEAAEEEQDPGDAAPEVAPAGKPATKTGGGAGADCVSVGRASAGWLVNGVRLESSKRIMARADTNWGTPETVSGIKAAVDAVHAKFPKTPRLVVGDLTKKGGGRLRPHRSHQSGRDADLGYFLKTPQTSTYFQDFEVSELDLPRTWTLISALLASGGVEYIFIDRALQAPLRAYAAKHGRLSTGRLDVLFSSTSGKKGTDTIIRHARGHRKHMHVRFRAAASVKAAQVWIAHGGAKKLKPVAVEYKVKSGDNLGRIAKKHKTTVAKLLEYNKLAPTALLKIGQRLVVGYRPPKL